MANFIGLVYATLKSEGIDTAGMSTDEAVKKYNELQKEGGGKAGENEGTPAENRKLEEKGYTFKKNTKNGEQIVNKYQQDGETHIIAKAEDGNFVVGYNYNEDKGTFENSAKFSSMKEAEQAFRKNNPNARLTEQNLSKGKKQSLVDTGKIDKTISKLEEGQKSNKIDYENVKYPAGTSKEYTMGVNKKYEQALPVLEKLGIKEEDFGGQKSKEGGYEDKTREIMEKYVFTPFKEKYPKGNNEAWQKDFQPIYDAIDAVADKHYNDWYIKNN